MAELNTVTCNMCNTLKRETNHWWKGYIVETVDANGEHKPIGVLILPIDAERIVWPIFRQQLPSASVHLCGEEHAQKWQGQELHKIAAAARPASPAPAPMPVPERSTYIGPQGSVTV